MCRKRSERPPFEGEGIRSLRQKMSILPFLFAALLGAVYVVMGVSLVHGEKAQDRSRVFLVKSFFLGSPLLFILGVLGELMLCESLLEGESGALVLLASVITVLFLFIAANAVFLIVAMRRTPGKD